MATQNEKREKTEKMKEWKKWEGTQKIENENKIVENTK